MNSYFLKQSVRWNAFYQHFTTDSDVQQAIRVKEGLNQGIIF